MALQKVLLLATTLAGSLLKINEKAEGWEDDQVILLQCDFPVGAPCVPGPHGCLPCRVASHSFPVFPGPHCAVLRCLPSLLVAAVTLPKAP